MSVRSSVQSHGEICPDPAAHAKDTKLEDSAAKAALYATSPSKRSSANPLGPDGKLSSASAATSLKYAQAHELPSFPSVGIDTGSSGNQAANLSYNNQKSFEHWKPELSSSASKAALLAHKDGGKLDLWQPSASQNGLTAAGAAMGIKSSPQLDYGYTDDGRKKALLAATLSVSGRGKTPEAPAAKLYPDQDNAAANALNAASVAHRPSTRNTDYGPMSDPANEASRITHGTNFNRALYTEKPPVDIELEEQKYQAALRASSISLAKQMQEVQARKSEDAYYSGLVADDRSHAARTGSKNTPDNIRAQALSYINVQEAAHKLAAERLRKLDPDGVLAYQEHWGIGAYAEDKQTPEKTRQKPKMNSIRRRRQPNDDEDSSDDEADAAEAARIRNQMRGISSDIAGVDNKKRDKDRSDLLALAQKQVRARMNAMDDKVFKETGKASPALMADWEEKARAKAAENNEERMKNYGKVHIGGGQYMDQSELDAIAQRRMQPTLDEITDSAEKQRARDAEIALDLKQRKEEEAAQKARDKETAAELKRVKNEEKMQNQAERHVERQKQAEIKREQKEQEKEIKEQEKAEKEYAKMEKRMQKEQERQAKEDQKIWLKQKEEAEKERQRRSVEKPVATGAAAGAVGGGAAAAAVAEHEGQKDSVLGENSAASPATHIAHDETAHDPAGVPTSFEESAPAFEEPSSSKATEAAPVAAAAPVEAAAPIHTQPEPAEPEPVSKSVAEPEPVKEKPSKSEKVAPVAVGAAAAPAAATAASSDRKSQDTTTRSHSKSESTDGTKKKGSLFGRIKKAIQDPASDHTAEGSAATKHEMQATDYSSKPEEKHRSLKEPFFKRVTRAINDPQSEHTPEGTSATEHHLQAQNFEHENTGVPGKGKEPIRNRSPSPDFDNEEETPTIRPALGSKEPTRESVDDWQEARDRFDEPTPRESKSKFSEDV